MFYIYIYVHSAHQRTLQKPSTSQVLDDSGIRASSQDCSIFSSLTLIVYHISERPSSENCITQGPFHRLLSQINLLVPTGHKSPPHVI